MAAKHLLTAFHYLLAAVLVPLGLVWAARVADWNPVAGVVAGLMAIVLPVLVATRVAWASGYAAGRAEAAAAEPSLHPTGPSGSLSDDSSPPSRPGG